MSDYWLKSAISFQRGSVDPKFHVEGVAPHQPFFFSEKWDKCSFVWYINLDRSFYCFVTMHACDGQTDGQNSPHYTASALHAAR